MIKLSNVTKKFGEKTVISDLSYTFADGTVYILHGKSGSGKSTLLSLIARTDKKYEGKIECGTVSMSFQNANLLPSLSVLDNVLLAVHPKNKPQDQSAIEFLSAEKMRAELLLSELGITDFNQFPAALSGGMQARVGVARALMKPADIYLFDEPFSGLDRESIARTAAVIRKNTEGKTVIAVVHDSMEVPFFADVTLELQRDTASCLGRIL